MKHFCFLVSLQAGCTVISIVFLTLASAVFLVNLPHLVANRFLIIISVWLILMICVAITSFMAAYLESSGVAEFTLLILAATTFYWFCVSIIPFFSTNYRWTSNLCLNQRCGESLWLTALHYHKLKIDRPHKSKFMHGDGIFNVTSIFPNYNTKNGSDGITINAKEDREPEKISRKPSTLEFHNLSVMIEDNNQSFLNFSNVPDLSNSNEIRKEYYRNATNDTIQIEMSSENTGLRSMSMKEGSDNSLSFPKLRNSNDSWLQINMNSNIHDGKFPRLADNSLQLSQNNDSLLSKNDVVFYYDDAEPVKKSNQFWEKWSIGLRIVSFFLLLVNLTFHVYCWFAMYCYWNLLRRYLHDVYQSSDFNESDTYSESTKSSWQDR